MTKDKFASQKKKEDQLIKKELDDIGLSTNGYRGNPNIKGPNEIISYTPEHIEEIKKCMNDVVYFGEHYFTIVNLDRGKEKIKLYDYQKDMLRHMQNNNFAMILSSRQIGKTTVASIFLLWYTIFNSDKTVGILANKNRTAQMILSRIQLAYGLLPKWLQPGVKEGGYNKQSMEFENGSRMFSASTSSSSVRGEAVNLLYLDECAFIEPNQWEEFWASTFPVISSSKNSRVVMVTTPNGCNYFYDMWCQALEGKSPFKTIKFTWEVVPTRDKEWEENMRGALGSEQFEQEFNCSFAFSEYALVPGNIIDRCLAEKDKPLYETNGLTVFHEPQEHHTYFMSCDVANMGADYSTFILFDITSYPYIEVCSFRANLSYILFAPVIASISQKYNNAAVLVESNDIGQALIHSLNNEYEVELAMSRATMDDGRPHSRIMFRQGQRTTPKSKLGGCLLLKTYLDNGKIKVSNVNFYTELRKFVRNNTGSYSAEDDGVHDDSVMCVVNFCWYINSKVFKTTYDRTLSEEMRKSFDEELEEMYGLPMPQRYDDVVPDETKNSSGWIINPDAETLNWLNS